MILSNLSNTRRFWIVVWLFSICFLVVCAVVIGGATRLTNSGLSITEWKPLVGAIPPMNHEDWLAAFEAYKKIPEYTLEHSHLDLDGFKFIFFWEYLHRNIGRLLGIVFVFPFIFFWASGWLDRSFRRRLLIGLALGFSQGVLGWFMVKSGLTDRVDVSHYRLMAHLVLAFFIFSYFLRLILDLTWGWNTQREKTPQSRHLRMIGAVVHSILGFQIVWGAFVAGLRAGYSFSTFPKMGDDWLPQLAFTFEPVWMNFFENPILVQFIHRWLGAIVVIGVICFWWKSKKLKLSRISCRLSDFLLLAVALQFLLGVLTLLSGMSLVIALSHQFGALILFGLLQANSYMLGRIKLTRE